MLERITAENGSMILRQDGRLLASMVAPQAEAEEWLARRTALLTDVKAIFVLGAGAGYHVEALARRAVGEIIVIEYSPAIAAAAQSIHAFPAKVHFVCAQKSQQLRASAEIKAAVAGSTVVLEHGPSLVAAPTFYADSRRLLLGRDWGALTWQWRLKGLAPLDSPPKIHNSDEPLTIYDLEQTELVQNSEERERMLIKALRELVK